MLAVPKRQNIETRLTASQERLLAKLIPYRTEDHIANIRRLMLIGHSYDDARRKTITIVGL